MSDSYPENLSFEIDRVALRKYLRAQWLLLWLYPLAFLGVLFGFVLFSNQLEKGRLASGEILAAAVFSIGGGLAVGASLGLAGHFIFTYRSSRRFADTVELSVEGPFLRLRHQSKRRMDRKLHFRSIVDFVCAEDSLMRRYGIQSLQLTTTSGGPHGHGGLVINGLKDCLKVRDILAEIDRQREHH